MRVSNELAHIDSLPTDSLEHLTLSRLSIASYPEVSDLRFPRLRSLTLSDCSPYARSQLPSFFSHFPSLVSLEIDNENIDQSLVEAALTSIPPSPFLSSLRVLILPQAPFLQLFTPKLLAHNHRTREPLALPRYTLPRSIEALTLTRVTFPETLLGPFLGFVRKYAEWGGGRLRRVEVELEKGE
ncbi:uncharacterized protein JCM6883_003138 [Sporobolomyces salmoneus]|uniref:uncharacterized protein n=1 Tax=Sporobolomyces salmoneus TaxID=183962 RepID=UPI00317D9DCC